MPDHGVTGDAVWADVMRRFDYRCGCSGQCGSSHRTTKSRCRRLHYEHGSADQRLLAIPIDPHTADPGACPPLLLMAACPACADGIRRAAARTAAAEPTDDQLDLFGAQPEPCATPPCTDRDDTEDPMPTTVTIPAPVGTADIIRLADALTAAHAAGIDLRLAPNPYVMWDPARHRYVATAGLTVPASEYPATWTGGHALVVEAGDCELYGRCQCGTDLGVIRADRSLDTTLAAAWERHVMSA